MSSDDAHADLSFGEITIDALTAAGQQVCTNISSSPDDILEAEQQVIISVASIAVPAWPNIDVSEVSLLIDPPCENLTITIAPSDTEGKCELLCTVHYTRPLHHYCKSVLIVLL